MLRVFSEERQFQLEKIEHNYIEYLWFMTFSLKTVVYDILIEDRYYLFHLKT